MSAPSYIDPYRDALNDGIAYAERTATAKGAGFFGAEMSWETVDDMPVAIVEAVVDHESQWKPDAYHVNEGGAPDIGLGQINLQGAEIGWYIAAGNPNTNEASLRSPNTNLRVTSLGLLGRFLRSGKDNWFNAAIGYYGCQSIQDPRTDGPIDCRTYYNSVRERVVDWYGEDYAKELEGGGGAGAPGDDCAQYDCAWWDVVCITKKNTCIITNAGSTAVNVGTDAATSALMASLPYIGAAAAAAAMILVGLIALAR